MIFLIIAFIICILISLYYTRHIEMDSIKRDQELRYDIEYLKNRINDIQHDDMK